MFLGLFLLILENLTTFFMSYAHALELLLYVHGLFYVLLYLIANSLRGIYMTQYEFTYILYLVLYLTHLH